MASGWRNAIAALAVLGGLAALVAVPPVIAAGLPDEQPVPDGRRLAVGYGVSLLPPAGSRLAVGPSRPGSGDVELRVAGVIMELHAVEVRGSRGRYAAHARHKLSRDDGLRPGTARPVATDAGVTGEQGPLLGGPDRPHGCYTIFSARSAGVVVVILRVPDCEVMPDGVRAAVASITFEKVGAV